MKTTCFDFASAGMSRTDVSYCVCLLTCPLRPSNLDFCFTLTCARRPTAAAKQSSSATRQNAKRERAEESVDARAADGRVGRALRSRGEHHFLPCRGGAAE